MAEEIGLKPGIFCFIRAPRLESRGNMNGRVCNEWMLLKLLIIVPDFSPGYIEINQNISGL
ncbi:hypothetical protein BIU88_04385 [Chlorobaculum limnaeum]|uniref:Uncharacterized protein n=1 Tax=Chlorobaculum limnaeum TaxID=274537 RepID=A0A1D8D3A3_CHLLM|nr:hypothetical protein BIU88_04385 [Chlorobaculum limnaeum]